MFDWNEAYKGDTSDYQPPDPLALRVIEALAPGRALDVGCGAGGLAMELAERGWSVTGIDLADTAVAAARKIAAARGVAATFEVADATQWEPRERYDLVISTFALPTSVAERAAVFAMMREAAAPGATLVIKEYDSTMRRLSAFAEYDLPTVQELRRAFAGFDIVRAKLVDSPTVGFDEPASAALLHARNVGSADRNPTPALAEGGSEP